MIIDAHYHIGRGDFLDDLFQVEADVATLLRHQREAGVDRTVIFPVKCQHYRQPNTDIARLCAEDPRFLGFGRVACSSEDAPQEAEFAVRELKLRGIKIHSMDGFPTRAALDKLEELGVPVLFHSGMGLAPSKFEAVARSYPALTMILAHVGTELTWENMFNYPEQAIRLAAEYEQVYVDTSAVYLLHVLERAVKVCGPAKMIFGSDGPWFHPAVALRQIELLGLSEGELQAVRSGNIARILGLAAQGPGRQDPPARRSPV
jgi:hypothetical protein